VTQTRNKLGIKTEDDQSAEWLLEFRMTNPAVFCHVIPKSLLEMREGWVIEGFGWQRLEQTVAAMFEHGVWNIWKKNHAWYR
jgi:hypothetical protein